MKVTVVKKFRDKNHFPTIYKVGQVVTLKDKSRVESLKQRGLVEDFKKVEKPEVEKPEVEETKEVEKPRKPRAKKPNKKK